MTTCEHACVRVRACVRSCVRVCICSRMCASEHMHDCVIIHACLQGVACSVCRYVVFAC